MPCDGSLLPGQSLTERKIEVREAVERLAKALATGRARAIVGPQGAITFGGEGASVVGDYRISDACAYRKIMSTGSALARAALAKAEMMAGRTVDRKVVASGLHSHDQGRNWGLDK
jgi:hypothetical protein